MASGGEPPSHRTQIRRSSGPWRLPQGKMGRERGGDGEVASACFLSRASPSPARWKERLGDDAGKRTGSMGKRCTFLLPSGDQIDQLGTSTRHGRRENQARAHKQPQRCGKCPQNSYIRPSLQLVVHLPSVAFKVEKMMLFPYGFPRL
jgi:hypothetical protein